jgi:serine protease
MKTFPRPSATAWLCLAVLSASTAWSAAAERVYVLFQPGAKAAASAAVAASGGRVHHEFDDLQAIAVSVPSAALTGLSRNPNVLAIEPDPERELFSNTSTSTQTTPYGIDLVQATTVQTGGTIGANVKVGVIDSGVHRDHEDFQHLMTSNLLTGYPDGDYTNERTWHRDLLSHGTHVSGTIAAGNNTVGVVGVAPGAAIHMVKVFGDTGNWVHSSDLLDAARRAANAGSRVINMSLGGSRASRTERNGMDSLYQNGVLLVAAAGNDGTTSLSYPASYDSVISVAAVDANSMVAEFSQKNAQVELAAPGVSVLSTTSYIEDITLLVDGTSYGANHIEYAARASATAALVDGGLATSTNAAWSGKVVLVQRGSISFADKVKNVQASGGVACIIYNNVEGELFATLGSASGWTIPALGITQADGQVLLTKVGRSTTVTSAFEQPASGYAKYDGTSMATPHVAGVAALLWSKYPQATVAQVRQALQTTALDLGADGRDNSYGYGLVQAQAALSGLGALVGAGEGGGGGGGGDTTPPVISNVTSTDPVKNGSFSISWTTNEPTTGSVTFTTGGTYPSSTLSTSHKLNFRGTKGVTYTYYVDATDAAGNSATSGPHTHQN